MTTAEATTEAVTTAPPEQLLTPPEPENPEPIYLGLAGEELTAAINKMKKENPTFIEIINAVVWIDENGNSVIAECNNVNGINTVIKIDRYFRPKMTEGIFEDIKMRKLTMFELVELIGVPVSFRDMTDPLRFTYMGPNLKEKAIILWFMPSMAQPIIISDAKTPNIKNCDYTELFEDLCKKYSFESFELIRIFVQETDDGKYELCMQGTYNADKIPWEKSVEISKEKYDYNCNYRYVKNGVLYNAVVTEEFPEIFYDCPRIDGPLRKLINQ
jgi:hypothetical protein